MAAGRNLSLTEELEKLEQSITLTLQEIDHNFSRAHRTVTGSILPIVENYAKHSEAVWEGSKFWKQFFEASANVSLSGYEEAPEEDLTNQDDATATHTETSAYDSPSIRETDYTITGADGRNIRREDMDESILSSPSVAHAHSTPRMPNTSRQATKTNEGNSAATFADLGSPYETLKREVHGDSSPLSASAAPTTPGRNQRHDHHEEASMTPTSSPFVSTTAQRSTQAHQQRPQNNDPLLHRVLDKTYRIQATPHGTARKPKPSAQKAKPTPSSTAQNTRRQLFTAADSSPLDSSPIAPMQLRADIFSSPLKGAATPRTPGVSVYNTPGAKKHGIKESARKEPQPSASQFTGSRGGVWDSDDDDDGFEEGFSPPKTMQFHVPQSRLLQTPAREASKKIVEDLLLTAGGDITDTGELDDRVEEDSPSVVRRDVELDDSF